MSNLIYPCELYFTLFLRTSRMPKRTNPHPTHNSDWTRWFSSTALVAIGGGKETHCQETRDHITDGRDKMAALCNA